MVEHLEQRKSNLSQYIDLVTMSKADNFIGKYEMEELWRQQLRLRVTQNQHDEIVTEILGAGWGDGVHRQELQKYRTILRSAAEDGVIDEDEKQELLEFRDANDITDEEHRSCMLELLSRISVDPRASIVAGQHNTK
jgi:hypothetical protein